MAGMSRVVGAQVAVWIIAVGDRPRALVADPDRSLRRSVGGGQGYMGGEIIHDPNAVAPDGSLGVYRYQFQPYEYIPPLGYVARSYEGLDGQHAAA